MLVKDIMHRAVCIDPQESIAAAARKLRDEHVGCLAVCRGAQVFGILTDRDIVVRSAAQRRDPGEMTVGEAMSAGALCCAHNDTAENAAGLMQRRHVRRLIVLDVHSHVIGVVSASDVGPGNLGEWVSHPPPFEVVFYKEVLDHFGHPHRCELMRVPVAAGARDEAVRVAIREFEEARQLSRWDALADDYEVISAFADP
ncbi:CBS domain-containing protein [Paraburkholderia mimosarum]|uniref:CBS domain-containing protein n=1 Tax=Paraburkholderia mimosarum TaxID=312026 RepID=UPI00041114C2|nr:CBS domain-containing protein [Paraburkholderia mimosarum]